MIAVETSVDQIYFLTGVTNVTFLSLSILSGERDIYSELKYAYATQTFK